VPPEARPSDGALGVVVPTLDSAAGLGRCLEALDSGASLVGEVVVADGGSTDATREVAARYGARVIATARGRGAQLAAGAAVVTAPWLLFLHADTRLAPGWAQAVHRFMAGPNHNRAAVFRFALDDDAPGARRVEFLVRWRCRLLALPYGDQGLLIGRRLFDAIGGFRPLPLYEDVDIVRRLGRARLTMLEHRAVTSAARYRRSGYVLRPARNLFCLTLYYLGVPPTVLQRLYG
jgi:rSAM/selenodomain-associated transferase 2